mmetsp:Transcript_14957/g.37920  ORF Transcript_14957/g.37920 Transcript_14957/m.37920 type:complete len:250 (-) Transcript_14957:291-1040(-)
MRVVRHHQACDEEGHDAGKAERLSDDESQVGQEKDEGHLVRAVDLAEKGESAGEGLAPGDPLRRRGPTEPVSICPLVVGAAEGPHAHQERRKEADADPDERAQRKSDEEAKEDVRDHARERLVHSDAPVGVADAPEEDDGRRVVDDSLPEDDGVQQRRPVRVEDLQDGDAVRGGHDGADAEARARREGSKRRRGNRDDKEGNDGAHQAKQRNHRRILEEAVLVHRVPLVEDNRWQEDVEESLAVEGKRD